MDNPLAPADAGMHSSEISDRFLNQLGPLLILTSIFFLNFIARVTLVPLIPEIEINFNLTHAEAGALFFLTVPLASVVGDGLVPIFIGIIGDISSFAIAIAICGGLITAGAFANGILKFHGQEI